eukprot:TRINITY_DN5648_c0_g1_i2.p1 TRINITY_DN5648_c0_g1~~TRINITY_DN5648_c0_g1_i2.p1  ORF type:complete len:386 (-),score=51.69 TRINITY_DN5648_c0_g1_i2:21-1178(-)
MALFVSFLSIFVLAVVASTPTPTHTPSETQTMTPTSTSSKTPTYSSTPSDSPTISPTTSLTSSATQTRTPTPTSTYTKSSTPTYTSTKTRTSSRTRSVSISPSSTQTEYFVVVSESKAVEIAAFVIACVAAALAICLVCLAILALMKAAPKAIPPPAAPPVVPPAPLPIVVGPEYLQQVRQLQENNKRNAIQVNAGVDKAEKSLFELEQWVSNTFNTWELKRAPQPLGPPGSDSYVEQQIVMLMSALDRLRAPQPIPVPIIPSAPTDKRVVKLAKEIGSHVDRMKHLENSWQNLFDASGHDIVAITQGLNSRNVPRVHEPYPTPRFYNEYPQLDFEDVPRAAPPTPSAVYYDYTPAGLPPPPPPPPRSGIKPRQPYVYDLYDNFE